MKRSKGKFKKAFAKLSQFVKKYSSIGISETIANIIELFFQGIRNSSNAFWFLFLAGLVFPFIILLLAILIIKKLATNFFEHITNFLKSTYRVINYVYKAIKNLILKIYNFIKTWFIIAIGEIKFYFLKIETSSKKFKQAWGEVLTFFWDCLTYLVKKIFNDQTKFDSQYANSHFKLFFEAIITPLAWGMWLLVSLPMIIILAISSIVVFPPLLHRAIRIGISSNPQEVFSFSEEHFDIDAMGEIDLTVNPSPELIKPNSERPTLNDIIYTFVGISILLITSYIYINNDETILQTLHSLGAWIQLPSQESIDLNDFTVQNGGFEDSELVGWWSSSSSDSSLTIYGTVKVNGLVESPFKGEGMAILFRQKEDTNIISQVVSIPEISDPYIQFHYKIISGERECLNNTAAVIAELYNSDDAKKAVLWSKNLCKYNNSENWVLHKINMGDYRGTTIKLSFMVVTTNDSQSSFFLFDEVRFDFNSGH